MKCVTRPRCLSILLLFFVILAQLAPAFPTEARARFLSTNQSKPAAARPEIVLQAGISSPQAQIRFSPDGRLLASMSIDGNAVKLWETATGRVVRQIEIGISAMTVSALTRPFRFSADGRTLIVAADGRIRRWEVETGRELNSTALAGVKDHFSALLSEDARIFASSSIDNSAVRVWETATGRELASIALEQEEHLAAQDALALSPDGSLLAVTTETIKGSINKIETKMQITLWETAGGRKARTLKVQPAQMVVGEARPVVLAFSDDGKWLALRDSNSLKIWEESREVSSIAPARILKSSDPAFIQIEGRFAFSPDRRTVSVISDNGQVKLIDSSSAATLRTLAGHKDHVVAVSFSTDGKVIATAGTDNQIKLWDSATGNEVRTLSGAAMAIRDVAFSPDGRVLTLGSRNAASLWELATGGVRRGVVLPDNGAGWRGMISGNRMLSRDGRLLVSGSGTDAVAKVWEITTGRELQSLQLAQGKELGNAAFNSDGRVVAIVEKEKKKADQLGAQLPSPQPRPERQAQVPAGQMPGGQMPGGQMADMTKLIEMMRKDPKKAQEQMKKMQEQAKKMQEAVEKGDMSAVASAMQSLGVSVPGMNPAASPNNIKIVEVATGRQLQTIPLKVGLFGQLSADSPLSSAVVSLSPDGRVLASASGFGSPITLRDVNTGQELRALNPRLSMGVYGLAWSADGRRLASAHWAKKGSLDDPNATNSFSIDDMNFPVKVWDAETGNELQSFTGHNNFVSVLAFSRDGRWVASGSNDSTVKLWDATTGREARTLAGHTGPVVAIDFSPDGRFVVSGSDDGSARLWEAQTGNLLASLVSLNGGDDWLVVTPDGLFDGSPGGWNQILWRFTENTFDVSPVEIFFNEFYYPGLLPDLLAGKKVRATSDVSQKDRRQPKVAISAGQQNVTNVSERELKIRIDITDAPAGAQDVRLFRNGSLVRAWRGDVLKGQPGATFETTVRVVAGQNRFTAYAFNRDNVKSADALLSITGSDSLKRTGTLHLLAVGVNRYANPGYNLKYAVADVRAVAEELQRQQTKIGQYGEVEFTYLLDGEATKANLMYALKRLAGSRDAVLPERAPAALEKIKAAEPEDAVIIYFAGHGTAQDQRFYLIPHDLGYDGPRNDLDEEGLKKILAHSISDLELEQALEAVDAGHTLMVIDACNSGQALEAEEKRRGPMNSKGLAQLAYEKGMYILTAAQSYQAALEAEELGHGYLTYALVEEGLKRAAADRLPKDSRILVREWLDYATERVPRMQEAEMRAARELKQNLAFVEGEEKVADPDKRSLQRPRVFYRRETEAQPLIVARP